jgi:hypothetical protein
MGGSSVVPAQQLLLLSELAPFRADSLGWSVRMFPFLRLYLVLWLQTVVNVDGKFAKTRILPSGSSARVKLPLNVTLRRDHTAMILSVRGGAQPPPPPPPLLLTISETQEAFKGSYSVQVALCLMRLGCILGSFLYQGCLAVADWSPFLAAQIERKAVVRIAQEVNFLLPGGLLSWFFARVMQDKARILGFARPPTGSISWRASDLCIRSAHCWNISSTRAGHSSVEGKGTNPV